MRGVLVLLLLVASLAAGCAERGKPAPVAAPGDDASAAPEGSPAGGGGGPVSVGGGASGGPGLGLQAVGQAAAPGGYALRVHEDRAYVATLTTAEGVSVFDVSDPLAPVHLGGTPPGTFARSVDVLDYGATTAVAISTGTELEVWNLTDPASPGLLASFAFGSHNVAVHPEARVIYNARNVWDGVGGAMEIVNASDPANIHLHGTFTFPPFAADGSPVHNQGCHDLTVWPDQDRAYCAAYEQSLVLDVSDPLAPVVLTAIANPAISDHHTAFPILDHTVLVISDEWAANLAWGCLAHEVPGVTEAPVGALWFYDLTTSPPQALSWLAGPRAPPEPTYLQYGPNAMCTSHNGAELGDGTGLIAFGWFTAGLLLVDASDPEHPVLLDRQDYGGAVGDARWYEGRVYAADDGVGLTVWDVA